MRGFFWKLKKGKIFNEAFVIRILTKTTLLITDTGHGCAWKIMICSLAKESKFFFINEMIKVLLQGHPWPLADMLKMLVVLLLRMIWWSVEESKLKQWKFPWILKPQQLTNKSFFSVTGRYAVGIPKMEGSYSMLTIK